ncbi:HK97-gp10 family putative phage morphogenesis protein [Acutalibacter intestini]|uniref:HK97-gp10 family putative phage morphogenesis protein n=1 Tax=Acutalibacter intestini TaxID=3093659 RepID=UPI002AC8E905|nr:HK97-gp10 family putative phage morphogenesis protein [Acutalibacter sp. M00204]
MARFEVNGIEGFEDKILKREAAATAAVPAMLKAGAAVLVDAQQAEIRSTFHSGRVTGDLASSIKATSVKKKDSTQYVEVYPQGTNRRGERNATVGFVHQYGRSNMPARPWFTSANEKAAGEVQEVMRQEWEKQQGGGAE